MVVGDAVDAEQNLRDFALAGVMLAGVDGTQHRLEPSSLLGGHALIGRNLVSRQVPHQTIQRCEAIEPVGVDLDGDGERIVRPDRGIGDQMQAGTDIA